jgi:cellulose synthase/poly-beta-1,6-N-acetylglucosamine synthase-like glycosyltransferase
VKWILELSYIDLVLMFWPLILFDLSRVLGKSILLFAHNLVKPASKKENIEGFNPKVSIIIPAHDEEKYIVRSIESALETDYNRKEIIVVDDGSRDLTYQLAFPYYEKGLINLVQLEKPSGSKAGALNFGLLFATGEVIVIVDADTLIERDSIKRIIAPLSSSNVNSVAGNIRVFRSNNNFLEKLQAYEYLISFELGRSFNEIMGNLLFVSGGFGAFKRKYFESTGKYDRDILTEDLDFSIKTIKHEGRIIYQENAVSSTIVPSSWREWYNQRIRWSRGQAETIWKHRNLLGVGTYAPKLILSYLDMILMDFVLLFLRYFWFVYYILHNLQVAPYVFTLTLLIYLIMEIVVFLSSVSISRRKEDLRLFWLIPLIVIFYRQIYSFIRLNGYMNWLYKRKSQW